MFLLYAFMHQILSLVSEGIFREKIFMDLSNSYVRRNLVDIPLHPFMHQVLSLESKGIFGKKIFNDLSNLLLPCHTFKSKGIKIGIYFSNFLCSILLSFESEGIFGKKISDDLANFLKFLVRRNVWEKIYDNLANFLCIIVCVFSQK